MCRDVKYIILLYGSLRNYHNTNTDATRHSVTMVTAEIGLDRSNEASSFGLQQRQEVLQQ